ncbi:MAG: hypothetical protein AAF560_02540 [Acidobacteriota bacterium]
MIDEPRRHRRYMLLVGAAILATAPFPFIGRETVMFWGLPLWLWWSFGFTATLSGLTAYGMLRLWRDDSDSASG